MRFEPKALLSDLSHYFDLYIYFIATIFFNIFLFRSYISDHVKVYRISKPKIEGVNVQVI